MNLRQIEIFRAVMSTGSVSDAARLLHVSAPSVSRVLSHTESGVGFLLFERIRGRLHPTAEARRLYLEVAAVYRGVQRVNDLTQELAERRSGLVTLVSSPSIGQMLMPLAIGQFRDGNPEVRVHFQSLSHRLLKERLLDRRSEIGVSILPVDHPLLSTTPIARSRMVCICPRGHPLAAGSGVAVADLLDFPLIGYPHDTPFGQRVEALFAAHGRSPQVAVEVGSPQNACALVHVGAGIALVDEFSLAAWQDSRFKVLPVMDAAPIVADLVHLRSEPLSLAAQAFVRTLRSVLMQRGLSAPLASTEAPDRPAVGAGRAAG